MGVENIVLVLENAVCTIEDGVDKLGLKKDEYKKHYVLSNYQRNGKLNKILLKENSIKSKEYKIKEDKFKPVIFK